MSDLRAKDGQHALQWRYQPGATLTVKTPIRYRDAADSATPLTFMVWVYNEQPVDDMLTFRFGQGERSDAHFQASLNFQGWRGIAVPYRDMQGTPGAAMDRLTITAPTQAGTLYFDQLMPAVPVDNRWPLPDYTTPFANRAVNDMVSKNWSALLMYDEMLRQRFPTLNFDVAFSDSSGPSASLYRRFDDYQGIRSDSRVSPEQVGQNLEAYRRLGIRTLADGTVGGTPLDHPNRQHFMKVKGVFTPQTLDALTAGNPIRDVGKTLLQSARYLRSDSLTAQQRDALQRQFLDTTRYVLDQGFARGSGYQIITHVGYQTRELFDAWFIQRNLLAQHHLLAPTQQAMMWYNATGRIFEPAADIVDANVDILNTQLQWMVKSILMLPDPAQRDALLAQTSQWLAKTVLSSRGVGGGFKPDGSIFHHSQHYPAYAKDAFGGLAPTVYAMSSSPFRLPTEAHQRLKEVLLKMRIYTKETQIPLTLSGRHPTGLHSIAIAPFKWMALAGTPDGSQPVDQDLAAAYARLAGETQFAEIAAEAEPSGAWAMNYAAMAIQRRAGQQNDGRSWLAIARGFSRYLVGNESYEKNNRYGRYLQYGQLEIIPADPERQGFRHAGWDWNRYPGTTTVILPYPQLKAQLNQLPGAGIEEMLLSTERYVGANALDGNSMFAMKLHGHSKYGQESLRANKSYFLFDNRVIALGSNISNSDSQHPTETTLFQFAVPQQQPIGVNGERITQPDSLRTLQGAAHLVDPAGNSYWLPAGQQVRVSYRQQHSIDDRNDAPTQGLFAVASLLHGTAPQQQGYEYAIAIDDPDTKAPAYRVLQKDDTLHAVRDQLSGQEGYAFFRAAQHQGDGLLLATDAPLMAMLAPGGDTLRLSVVNPDLALYQGDDPEQRDADGKQQEVSIYSRPWRSSEPEPQRAQLTLKGHWQLAQPVSGTSLIRQGDNTLLHVTTHAAQPQVLTLNRG
ncbi:polysaccharide lyase beta-sandwich domain-containing protein [Edwardsiella ictaluri]|uniref:Chondroitin sulfate ABC lyase n=1 Tax=Edwardsiella ictaluri TaxID=67780 RepID=A0ABY8GL87_EDWIC|nr:chondroitinase family polysaccharide lyase [Edwardsiella ictaluri]WFN98078.1 polysaccharide lyase beta-sandwich domain-containing protein [Edwardsiella ictaluri]